MFQYRTHLEPPPNVTAVFENGTKSFISSLSSDDRNEFTMTKFKLKDYKGNEG